ncbi:MAG: TIGR03620 family F420-dependent LLM class oxidoreductase [bacterium]|nr:TIGR03620 family F420-dependent LLM class oxidoreductase [bacterium]
MRTDLGPLGVWTALDALSAPESANFAQQIEAWGYTALWTPEAVGRDPFSFIGFLAAQTEKLVFATGIANIYARDPMTMKGIHRTVAELAPGRFVLGLGVSHEHLVSRVRGHDYKKPVTTMRNFLDAMESALYMGRQPDEPAPIVLAALRDKMLELAATRTAGAHPYLVPPEHTERARKVMGPDAWLCPEQMVILETDASRARAVARKHLAIYFGLPNYQNNLKQFGYEQADFADGGSDRLLDAIVAWGDEQAIRDRIQAHRNAGANHVCIQAFRPDGEMSPDLGALEALAPRR